MSGEYTWVNKHIKICSIVFVIKELQIKTTRYNYTHIRMAEIQNNNTTTCWQGCGTTEILIHCIEKEMKIDIEEA